jgi:uncharacterized protein
MPSKTILRRCSLVLVVAASFVPTVLWALPIEQIPNPRKIQGNWVSDVANILQPETEQKLNTLINQLQAYNGSEIAVVTLPDSTPLATPKELATKLFNTWHIGQKDKDNGLLFLISVGDRRVEIETGYGIEAILPDAKVGRIIEQQITPAFKRGDFDAGTLSGTKAISQLLQGKEIDRGSDAWNSNLLKSLPPLAIFWVIFIFTIGFYSFVFYLPCFFFNSVGNLAASIQGLSGLVLVRGLGQSVKLLPRQSSRKKVWHMRFETIGAMRCAVCGGALEPVEDEAVERSLSPNEKAAVALGSLQFRGWRCRRCAPEAMHLRGYESTSTSFEHCPFCKELTVIIEAPYIIPNTNPPGPDLRITDSHCVNCDYVNQNKEFVRNWIVSDGDNSFGGGSSSSSGGSSGGGGAGGNW